jgi:malate dehydrogenase (oxaloacetate-decarboxylating)
MPDEALAGGARVVATGRSDYPNQVNNSLAFRGLFRGALDARARVINDAMKLAAAGRLASLVTEKEFEEGQIIPQAMNYDVAPSLAAAVAQAAMDTGVAHIRVEPLIVAQHCHDYIYEGIMSLVRSWRKCLSHRLRRTSHHQTPLTPSSDGSGYYANISVPHYSTVALSIPV